MSELQKAINRVSAWVSVIDRTTVVGKAFRVEEGAMEDHQFDLRTILAALAAAPDGDMITPPVPVVMSANWVCTNPNGVYQPPPDAEVLGHYERDGSVYPIYGSKRPPEPVGVTREWQPIETAPRDRTSILVYAANTGEAFVSFDSGRGWETPDDYNEHFDGEFSVPTHWMPLPAKPIAPTKTETPG